MSRTQKCKTCQHAKRATIDKLLVRGKPVNAIAKAYGLDESSLRRHVKHIQAVVAKAGKRREGRQVETMVNVYDEYANDLVAINKEIKSCLNPEVKQGWYTVKGKRLDMAMKYRFLGEWLGRGRGNGKGAEPAAIPDVVERMIDAVVTNDTTD